MKNCEICQLIQDDINFWTERSLDKTLNRFSQSSAFYQSFLRKKDLEEHQKEHQEEEKNMKNLNDYNCLAKLNLPANYENINKVSKLYQTIKAQVSDAFVALEGGVIIGIYSKENVSIEFVLE